ncbi:MAG: VCBS repeat-containing protein, partial [Bacteroidota bacterium]
MKNTLVPSLFVLFLLFLMYGCTTQESDSTLFDQLDPESTGLDFVNELSPTEEFNMYIFRNFYNGGGVAVGDVSGNGLPDLFFTGNMVSNRLYLNKGDFQFEDITEEAGLLSDGYWSTGASFADVNGNGHLDLFVTVSGEPGGDKRHNRLYINNGDNTFSERSQEFGVADTAFSTHGIFFDHNNDGWLDLYVTSNSMRSLSDGFSDVTGATRELPDPAGASKLYRNEEGKSFTDVTDEAGVYSSIIGFGLSAAAADINRSGLPDLYVANDFFERDYLYFNIENGVFEEQLEERIRSISFSSMGSDIADLNNDGWPDIYVSDMLPESEERLKSKMTIESWEEYQENVEKGFHHKFTRNTLQLNRGDGTFSEVGRLTDTHATDWSWAVLLADFDLNGFNDIFVANGIYKDLLDQDYIEQVANPRAIQEMISEGRDDVITTLMEQMSSEPQPNYAFGNAGGLQFENRTQAWGLGDPGFSSGAAWADLDGDGALDLVVSDVNGPARIYRNRALERHPERTWLRVDLDGEAPNTYGIGARLEVWAGGELRYREHYLQRGFQSSVEPGLFVGMGEAATADSLRLRWPDGRITRLEEIDLPARITLRQSEASPAERLLPNPPATMPGDFTAQDLQASGAERRSWQSPGFEATPSDSGRDANDREALQRPESEASQSDSGRNAKERTLPGLLRPVSLPPLTSRAHQRYDYSDFDRERLLMHMRSTEGPALCTGDVTGNGLADVYIGGARGQAGALWLQQTGGGFERGHREAFEQEVRPEETACALFDATGDGLADLYVVSGGNSFGSGSSALSDRMYVNDGAGGFTHTGQVLPTRRGFEPGSVAAPHDFTGDGIPDLFVGIRLRPFGVGLPASGYLLEGNGDGTFTDVTEGWAPQLLEAGMITDGLWADLTGDGSEELVITGEWMPVRVFASRGDRFEEITGELGMENTHGWWNGLAAGDVNGDGRVDLIGANHGRNSLFRASADQPVRMWAGDFARNG